MKLFKVISFIALFLLSMQTLAHSKLIVSEPADEAELAEAPEQVMLEFNREVRLVKLELTDATDEAVEIDFKPVLDKATQFTVELPELAADTYQVKWIAMSGDSHKMKGEFGFTLINEPATD